MLEDCATQMCYIRLTFRVILVHTLKSVVYQFYIVCSFLTKNSESLQLLILLQFYDFKIMMVSDKRKVWHFVVLRFKRSYQV